MHRETHKMTALLEVMGRNLANNYIFTLNVTRNYKTFEHNANELTHTTPKADHNNTKKEIPINFIDSYKFYILSDAN